MEENLIIVIPYDKKYRDDMLFCYLLAKEALGKMPNIREDLFDIQKNYFDNDDMFWLAIDANNRVVGMIGTKTVSAADLWLKRLFIKPNAKRQGIGTQLLGVVERFAKERNIPNLHTRFPDDFVEAAHFYYNNGFIETTRNEGLRHFCKNILAK